jgi:hypothetical protein
MESRLVLAFLLAASAAVSWADMVALHEMQFNVRLEDIEQAHCGTQAWRDWYRELSHRVREKSMHRRTLVYISAHSGLADRLVRPVFLAHLMSKRGTCTH